MLDPKSERADGWYGHQRDVLRFHVRTQEQQVSRQANGQPQSKWEAIASTSDVGNLETSWLIRVLDSDVGVFVRPTWEEFLPGKLLDEVP